MKKMLYVLIAIAMLISIPTHAFAEDQAVDKKIFVNEEYGYTYSEEVNADRNTVRTYENPTVTELREQLDSLRRISNYNVEISSEEKFAVIKSVLTDLGMEREFVECLSDESLDEYCSSPKIMTTQILSTASDRTMNETESEVKDDFMITFTVGYLPSAEYHYSGFKYSVSMTWFNMPKNREVDSIGVAVTASTISPATLSGWYSYKKTEYDNNDAISEETIRLTNNGLDATSNFGVGAGMLIDLPTDVYKSNVFGKSSLVTGYSNMRAYFEFTASMTYPSIAASFNACATYAHSITKTTLGDVSMSFDYDIVNNTPSLSYSISTKTETEKESTHVVFPYGLYYEPIEYERFN